MFFVNGILNIILLQYIFHVHETFVTKRGDIRWMYIVHGVTIQKKSKLYLYIKCVWREKIMIIVAVRVVDLLVSLLYLCHCCWYCNAATLRADNNVVDRDVYQLDEETDEAHDAEANSGGNSDFLELLAIGLGAALDQADWILGEKASRFSEFNNFVHGGGYRVYLIYGQMRNS